MAAVTLAPWPDALSANVQHTAALACLRAAAVGTNATDARLSAIGAAAAARVQDFAPGAPGAVKSEAVIRYAGWLASAARGDLVPVEAGSIKFEWRPTFDRHGFRQSGARAMLLPWHKPRALPLWKEDT